MSFELNYLFDHGTTRILKLDCPTFLGKWLVYDMLKDIYFLEMLFYKKQCFWISPNGALAWKMQDEMESDFGYTSSS